MNEILRVDTVSPRGVPELSTALPDLPSERRWEDSGEHPPFNFPLYLKLGMIGADFGCGSGLTTRQAMLATQSTVYGFDWDPRLLKMAAREFDDDARIAGGKLIWQKADLRKGIPLNDEKIDYAICVAVIENLGLERLLFLEELYWVLKPGGLVFISWTSVSPDYQERYKQDSLFTGEKNTFVVWKEEATRADKASFYHFLQQGERTKAREIFTRTGDRLVHHLSGKEELQAYFPPERFNLQSWEIIPGITARHKRKIQIARAVLRKN